jgi:hypothetical protein
MTSDSSIQSGTPRQASRPALPPVLQPGGRLDQIPSADHPTPLPEPAAKLREHLREDHGRLKDFISSRGKKGLGYEVEEEKVYRLALSWERPNYGEIYRIDPVLRVSVASLESMHDARDGWWPRAEADYAAQPDAYDQVLGALIPDDLRIGVRQSLETKAYREGSNATAAADWGAYRRLVRCRRRQPQRGLATGLEPLDDALGGGLRAVLFLGGDTWVGKTTLALTLTAGALRRCPDAAALVSSLEMPLTTIYDRLVCHAAGREYDALLPRAGTEEDEPWIEENLRQLEETVCPRLKVIDRQVLLFRGRPITRDMLIEDLLNLREAVNAREVLVVIDYFQLLGVSTTPGSALDADHQRLELIKEAHAAAESLNPGGANPFLVLAQVRKRDDRSGGLTLDDLLGSSIKYSPDGVLFLEPRPSRGLLPEPSIPVTLRLAKGRDGMTCKAIPLVFEYTRYRFSEEGVAQAGKIRADSSAQPASTAVRQGFLVGDPEE